MIDIQSLKELRELLPTAASAYGDRPALKFAGKVESISYQEISALSGVIASSLMRAGAQSGDRVILFSESRPEWMAALFGMWRLGITAVPLPTDTGPENLAGAFQFTGATHVVVSERTHKVVPEGVPTLRLDESRNRPSETLPEAPLDIALVGFTSGSTSRPRAVELSSANLLANLQALLAIRTTSPDANFLSLLPPAHLFELMVGQLAPLACGATVVYPQTLLPNRIIEALKQERISGLLTVPALLRALCLELVDQLVATRAVPASISHRDATEIVSWLNHRSNDQLTRIRRRLQALIGEDFELLIVGGSAHNPHWAAIAHAMKIRLETGYGLTEASPIVCLGDSAHCPPGSVGKPLPGTEIRISDDGEILVRGPSVMRGYFEDPHGTSESLVDGWLRTGDRGELDEKGHLFIRGRLKEAMVTEAGDTIYPEEIEPFYESSSFKEHCVVPFVGDDSNDHPVLCVVPASGQADANELDETFKRLRAGVPAKFRLSKMVRLESPLPRTAVGKIQRRQLAQALQEQEMEK